MSRLPLLVALVLPLAAMAQAPTPSLDVTVSAEPGAAGSTGEGAATVSGKVTLPPGWKLSIHTLTIRYAKDGGNTTLNTLVPINQPDFKTKINLKTGTYKVWAVIDVKDADGKERQISSTPSNVNVP
jgi:hypothetical protein